MALARSLTSGEMETSLPLAAESGAFRYRVGLWPLLSDNEPEAAMGVMATLALLLERHAGVLTYRLPVSIEDRADDDEYVWELAQSQFSVDDWELDDLDENVALWGTLESEAGQWTLNLEIESDLAEEDDIIELDYTAPSLRELMALLPDVAADSVEKITDHKLTRRLPVYAVGSESDATYRELLKRAFYWERDLFLYLWDVTWDDDQIRADLEKLIAAGQALKDEFGAWLVASLIARVLNPATADLAKLLFEPAQKLVTQFTDTPLPDILISQALYRLQYDTQAFDLLEGAAKQHPKHVETRAALVDLYWRDSRMQDALDELQDAIDDQVTDRNLLLRYGELLMVLRRGMMTPQRFLYIDPPDRLPVRGLEEAVGAYQAVLEKEPDDYFALQRKVALQVELNHPDLWKDFERLVDVDDTGDRVRVVVDEMDLLDDVNPAVRILKDAVAKHADRTDLKINLAAACLAAEQEETALEMLEAAEEMTEDPEAIADIERLFLIANDPEFEIKLGEITEAIDSGNAVAVKDVDFLEAALEDAPSFVEGYLLLSRAYRSRSDNAAVLETLLDGQKVAPDNPEITRMLATELWDAGEQQLAFDYLNKGLVKNPDSVALLALTGRYLFEDGQGDSARTYLARAESINPRSRTLLEVKQYIARSMRG
jgi:tetratricopeptide (TPR) repeat protein